MAEVFATVVGRVLSVTDRASSTYNDVTKTQEPVWTRDVKLNISRLPGDLWPQAPTGSITLTWSRPRDYAGDHPFGKLFPGDKLILDIKKHD